ILGWRSGIAIALGLCLQAFLLGHGGSTTLGVNTCVMTIPALLAGSAFRTFNRLNWSGNPLMRSLLIGVAFFFFLCCLIGSAMLIWPNHSATAANNAAIRTLSLLANPVFLALAALLSLLAAWLERRARLDRAFTMGMALGMFAVLATISLNAVVLVWGGTEDWRTIALIVFIAHLPIVFIEGIIAGFTISFLERVKPALLTLEYGTPPLRQDAQKGENSALMPSRLAARTRSITAPPILLLVTLLGLLTPAKAQAHRLEADYRVLPNGRVQIESWFDLTGDSPQSASVKVFRADDTLLTEGKLNDKGMFSFQVNYPDELRIVVNAGAGHQKQLLIPKTEFDRMRAATADSSANYTEDKPFADRRSRVSINEVLTGVAVLLALAAFVLSIRNAQRIREIRHQ
ncbi:MAG: energy-coupling factor ABC transporter permease, partial [Candidatus Acidiferrum sp.]